MYSNRIQVHKCTCRLAGCKKNKIHSDLIRFCLHSLIFAQNVNEEMIRTKNGRKKRKAEDSELGTGERKIRKRQVKRQIQAPGERKNLQLFLDQSNYELLLFHLAMHFR